MTLCDKIVLNETLLERFYQTYNLNDDLVFKL
jgi:hypothetical protein